MKFIQDLQKIEIEDFQYDTASAGRWFRRKIVQLERLYNKPITQSAILSEGERSARPMLGRLYFYRYAPKTRAKLEYYDTFPLTIPYRIKGKSMWGLNFHYLDLNTRRFLFSNLIDAGYATEEKTFNFTYKRVIGRSLFASMKPTVHQYDLTRLRSPLIEIDAKEWPLALYLPTEAFKKKAKAKVWEESLNRI